MKKNYMAPKMEVVIIDNEDMLEASLTLVGDAPASKEYEVLGKERIEDEASWGNLW